MSGEQSLSARLRERKTAIVAALAGLLVGASAVAFASIGSGDRAAGFSSDPDKARIEQVVRDYIMAHPEIIPEAMQVLRDRETAKVVDRHRKSIETPFAGAWAGNEDGDVILVEFFDYACTYCRASNPDIARLLKEDGKLKVVWRELPVLGEDSVAAARVSLAAAQQGRFVRFHERLFAAGHPNAETVAKTRDSLGVAAASSPAFDREIDRNFELARALNATGTPTFVVGDRVLQGAVGYDALKQAIEQARKKA